MGIETDLVLSTRDQVNAVLASLNPAQEFSGVYAKGTDPLSLSALLGVYTGEGYHDAYIDEFPTIAEQPSEEKAVYLVSERLRKHIEDMSTEAIPSIIEQWMATQEFELTGWDEPIATAFLTDVKAMLSRPEAQQRELWMTISL